MSDTPLTDANLKVLHPGVQPSTWYVQADFARTLERELAAALVRLERLEAALRALLNEVTTPSQQWVDGSAVNIARAALQPDGERKG